MARDKIVVLVAILAILLGGGYWAYQKYGPTRHEWVACTQEAKLCPDGSYVSRVAPACEFAACPHGATPVQPQQVPDTSTWKTYRNEKYGFEVKYPPGSKVIEESSEWGTNLGGFRIDLPSTLGTAISEKYLNMVINTISPTVKTCFAISEPVEDKLETVRIGDIEFKKIKGLSREYAGGDIYETVSYFVIRSNRCFTFEFVLSSSGAFDMERESTVFDSLLATFKFTK